MGDVKTVATAAVGTIDVGHARLIADLEAQTPCPARDNLLEYARQHRYHSYRSPLLHVDPKRVLEADLNATGYGELARKVIAGDYDNCADETTETDAAYWLLKRGFQKIFDPRRKQLVTANAAAAERKKICS